MTNRCQHTERTYQVVQPRQFRRKDEEGRRSTLSSLAAHPSRSFPPLRFLQTQTVLARCAKSAHLIDPLPRAQCLLDFGSSHRIPAQRILLRDSQSIHVASSERWSGVLGLGPGSSRAVSSKLAAIHVTVAAGTASAHVSDSIYVARVRTVRASAGARKKGTSTHIAA